MRDITQTDGGTTNECQFSGILRSTKPLRTVDK